jgi:hypothetical protein
MGEVRVPGRFGRIWGTRSQENGEPVHCVIRMEWNICVRIVRDGGSGGPSSCLDGYTKVGQRLGEIGEAVVCARFLAPPQIQRASVFGGGPKVD